MLGFKVDQAKSLFFDRAAVMKAVDDGTRKALSKAGAFIRQRARSRIRKRKGVSEPGSPPSSHLGLLKQFLFFAYEPNRRSVVVGPAKLNRIGDAPAALEYGGESLVLKSFRKKREARKVTIRPRPYMRPALEETMPKLAGMFKDQVRP